MSRAHAVAVGPLPAWLDRDRLLGGGWTWEPASRTASADRSTADAADVAARLRGVAFDGAPVTVAVTPPLGREAVRAGRTRLARALRDTTPGFTRPGVRLDDEGRYSLTPEVLALALARRHAGAAVLDAATGCGGNAIAFARAGCAVTALDVDPGRLALASHNAGIYGVSDRIRFARADATTHVPTATGALLFVDPPWGGAWDHARTTLDDLPLLAALLPLARHFPTVIAKVPPSFDTRTTPEARPEAWFGASPGDRARVKFLTLTWSR